MLHDVVRNLTPARSVITPRNVASWAARRPIISLNTHNSKGDSSSFNFNPNSSRSSDGSDGSDSNSECPKSVIDKSLVVSSEPDEAEPEDEG